VTDKDDIIQNGYITLPDRPGIGLELDEQVAREHQYPGTTWFE
jgi:L-alanine-DL-glutamate epimerase-like enolase superfamily enzyme